jgi:uncharacterized protein YdiU (UPF0061 family)
MNETDRQPGPDFRFANTYARLPEHFYSRLDPVPVSAPRLFQLNVPLARHLGLDPEALASPAGVETLAGNRVAAGSEPLAIAYAGHQFGHFVPVLGDGRANLLGEVGGRDIQLKGAGPTPFSRRGDGRAALGPVLREYIVSEAMHALGVPTTRALAAVTTGEPVYRETVLPGAVLTRVAASHIRVGTFQYFAANGDNDAVRLLADHVIARHYPPAAGAENPYLALLEGVIARQASLIAHWLLIGFIHGVMNTDNCSIAGETIDYGPCAFMDAYDPATVFSSIDRGARYAYGNQPRIAQWNLTRLAEALLPLLNEDRETAVAAAMDALRAFEPQFQAVYQAGLRRKIGLRTQQDGDTALVEKLLAIMVKTGADFTLTFRRMADAVIVGSFAEGEDFEAWTDRWRERLLAEHADPVETSRAMRAVNPAFIPRNHQIEAAIAAATEREDFSLFETLVTVLARPFDDQPDVAHLALPPLPEERVLQTFCGT